jgi:hypothetical protein
MMMIMMMMIIIIIIVTTRRNEMSLAALPSFFSLCGITLLHFKTPVFWNVTTLY